MSLGLRLHMQLDLRLGLGLGLGLSLGLDMEQRLALRLGHGLGAGRCLPGGKGAVPPVAGLVLDLGMNGVATGGAHIQMTPGL